MVDSLTNYVTVGACLAGAVVALLPPLRSGRHRRARGHPWNDRIAAALACSVVVIAVGGPYPASGSVALGIVLAVCIVAWRRQGREWASPGVIGSALVVSGLFGLLLGEIAELALGDASTQGAVVRWLLRTFECALVLLVLADALRAREASRRDELRRRVGGVGATPRAVAGAVRLAAAPHSRTAWLTVATVASLTALVMLAPPVGSPGRPWTASAAGPVDASRESGNAATSRVSVAEQGAYAATIGDVSAPLSVSAEPPGPARRDTAGDEPPGPAPDRPSREPETATPDPPAQTPPSGPDDSAPDQPPSPPTGEPPTGEPPPAPEQLPTSGGSPSHPDPGPTDGRGKSQSSNGRPASEDPPPGHTKPPGQDSQPDRGTPEGKGQGKNDQPPAQSTKGD